MDKDIYRKDFADKMTPGETYRPANGTEGMFFQAAYCEQCKHSDNCSIYVDAFFLDADDDKYPSEWQYGPDGQPTCTAFEE